MNAFLRIHGHNYEISLVMSDSILLVRDNKNYTLLKGRQLTWADWDCSLVDAHGDIVIPSIILSHIEINTI